MARAAYPYIPVPLPVSEAFPQGGTAHRPIAFAYISVAGGVPERLAVVLDTGADGCLFPLKLARLLHLDIERMPRATNRGVGSQSNLTCYTDVAIDLGNGIAFTAYAGFTEGLDAMGLGLLGQAGFFEQYNVEFRHSERLFTIESA